jgi:flagellar motor switch protein FliG
MALSGKRKAAILLMSLDAGSAAELLRCAKPDAITEIAAELAYLDASGYAKDEAAGDPMREFFDLLKQRSGRAGDAFLKKMLDGVVGRDRSKDIMGRIDALVSARDPFLPIRSLEASDIANALAGESGQVAALVVSELPAKKGAQLLTMLKDEVRQQAIRGMTSTQETSPQVKQRVATLVMERLKSGGGPRGQVNPAKKSDQFRKVALLLRSLPAEIRDVLVKTILEQNKDVGVEVQNLMVTWEDVASVADRSMQEVMRGLDSKKLALALYGADKATAGKVRANISERANAMIDEETSLLSSPKQDDIAKSREEILASLRELNSNGFLSFEEK